MTTYTASTTVPQSIEDSFAFIENPENLPYYFPRITKATIVGPELVRTTAVIDQDGADDTADEPVTSDAWFRADNTGHQIEWGSPTNDQYHGSLEVTETDNTTRLHLSLTTPTDYPGIQESLDEALAAIASKLADGSMADS